MSEKELRRVAGHKGTCRHSQTHYMPTPEPCTCGLDEALAADPDVVEVLLHAKEELEKCEEAIAEADRPGSHILAWVQEAAVWTALMTWLEQKFHLRLTEDDGWGRTDE